MTEADLKNACIAWFQDLGYVYKPGFDIAPRGAPAPVVGPVEEQGEP